MSSTYTKKKTIRRSTQPTNVVLQHTTGGSMAGYGGGGTLTATSMRRSYAGPTLPSGQLNKMSHGAVNKVIADKMKEKKELDGLNSRFADILEQQAMEQGKIAILLEQIELLKKERIPDINNMKELFEEEIEELKNANEALQKENHEKTTELLKKEDELEANEREIDALKKRIKELEEQLKTVTDRFCDMERDLRNQQMDTEHMVDSMNAKDEEIARQKNDLTAARNDLTFARNEQMKLAGQLDTALDDKEMECRNYENIIDHLREEVNVLKRCQPNYKDQFQSRFRAALEKVKQACEETYANKQAQMEAMYESRIAEIQSAQPRVRDSVDGVSREKTRELQSSMNRYKDDLARLQAEVDSWRNKYGQLEMDCNKRASDYEAQIDKLNDEIDRLNAEIADNAQEIHELEKEKMDLDSEIKTYEKLLDCSSQNLHSTLERSGGIQTQSGATLSGIISRGGGSGSASASGAGGSSSQSSSGKQMSMQTSSGQVRLNKKSFGKLSITQVANDGGYVEISNDKSQELDLTDYYIERYQNKTNTNVSFTFPKVKLPGNSKMRIYGKFFEEEMDHDKTQPGAKFIPLLADKLKKWNTGDGWFKCFNPKKTLEASVDLTFTS